MERKNLWLFEDIVMFVCFGLALVQAILSVLKNALSLEVSWAVILIPTWIMQALMIVTLVVLVVQEIKEKKDLWKM